MMERCSSWSYLRNCSLDENANFPTRLLVHPSNHDRWGTEREKVLNKHCMIHKQKTLYYTKGPPAVASMDAYKAAT